MSMLTEEIWHRTDAIKRIQTVFSVQFRTRKKETRYYTEFVTDIERKRHTSHETFHTDEACNKT